MGVSDIGLAREQAARRRRASGLLTDGQAELFDDLYRDHFDFVFRNLRRLGVRDASIDDAVQEVYMVVLRHIGRYEPGTHPRAWLFAIATRVAGNQRRSERRRGVPTPLHEHTLPAPGTVPFDLAAQREARDILHAFLDSLDEPKRTVFVMVELEEMTAPEISQALGVNINTIYARLRAARREFARATATLQCEPGGRDE